MKQPTDDLIRKLETHIEAAPDFSDSEISAIHEMVQAWRGIQALGKASRWVIVSLGLVAGALAAASSLSTSIKAGLKSWLA